MKDLNKSKLTEKVTGAVIVWLKEKGFKPVQTEVRITNGWVADIASILRPTQTELLDLKLIRKAPKWSPETQKDVTEWSSDVREMKRQIFTCLVEVKASRKDFIRDHKWDLPQPTNLAYLAVPKGLISEEEWPVGWGILEFSDDLIRARRWASPVNSPPELQRDVIFEVLMRLFHTTDPYTVTQRANTREEGDRFKAQRLSETIAGVCSIVESRQPDFELAMAFSKLPRATLIKPELKRLKLLHGLGKHIYDTLDAETVNAIRGPAKLRRFDLRRRLHLRAQQLMATD